jgi:hypothetical protein
MLTRGKRDSGSNEDGKLGDASGSFMACRSQSFTYTTIEKATAIHLSRPEEVPTKIALRQNLHNQCVVEDGSLAEKGTT